MICGGFLWWKITFNSIKFNGVIKREGQLCNHGRGSDFACQERRNVQIMGQIKICHLRTKFFFGYDM